MLRWVLLHRVSPTHGFLREPTEYPSLVYDLIELPGQRQIQRSAKAPDLAEQKKSPLC